MAELEAVKDKDKKILVEDRREDVRSPTNFEEHRLAFL